MAIVWAERVQKPLSEMPFDWVVATLKHLKAQTPKDPLIPSLEEFISLNRKLETLAAEELYVSIREGKVSMVKFKERLSDIREEGYDAASENAPYYHL